MTASRFIALAFSITAAASSQADSVSIRELVDVLRTVTPETSSAKVCEDATNNANEINSAALYYGSWHCFGQKRNIEGTVLLLVGQVRSMSDMQAFPPKTEEDKQTMASLYGIIFFQLGGTGIPELYRDPDSRRAVLSRLLQWQGQVPQGYDPGWVSTSAPSSIDFWLVFQPVLLARHKQVADYAAVISDDRYYNADLEFRELQKKNPRGFIAGTPDSNRSKELQSLMHRMFEEQRNRPSSLDGAQPNQPLHPTPTAAEAPASGAGERRR